MTVPEWRKLSTSEQNARWSTLTHAERDAIIESDNNVVRGLSPVQRNAAPPTAPVTPPEVAPESRVGIEPSAEAPRRVVDASGLGGVLADVREKSCYRGIRTATAVIAGSGYFSAVILLIIGLVAAASDIRGLLSPWLYWFTAVVVVLGTFMSHQTTLLIVDLVDLHVINEARRRRAEASTPEA